MSLTVNTQKEQAALAHYCRDGELTRVATLPSARSRVYRRLVCNGIQNALHNAYPITYGLLGDEAWYSLVRRFLSEHASQSPYYWRMPRELCDFVRAKGIATELERPYLDDLLLFEWLNVEVHMMPDMPVPVYQEAGDLWEDPIIIHPEFRLNRFTYPVFKAAERILTRVEGTYFLLTYRHPASLQVNFMELTALFALVLELLRSEPLPGEEAVEFAAEQLGLSFDDALCQQSLAVLQRMHSLGIILGFEL